VAATNRDLLKMVQRGEFREDLYYRLRVVEIRLPPLRERKEDIPLLTRHFAEKFSQRDGKKVDELPTEVLAAICAHDWPGNVRELENELRRAVVLAGDELRLEHLSSGVLERRGVRVGVDGAVEGGVDMKSAVADLERRSIEAAMLAAGGNKSRAAAELGISRFALQRKLDKYGLDALRREGAGDDPAPEG